MIFSYLILNLLRYTFELNPGFIVRLFMSQIAFLQSVNHGTFGHGLLQLHSCLQEHRPPLHQSYNNIVFCVSKSCGAQIVRRLYLTQPFSHIFIEQNHATHSLPKTTYPTAICLSFFFSLSIGSIKQNATKQHSFNRVECSAEQIFLHFVVRSSMKPRTI